MSLALFRKELREHGLVLLGTWALSALGFLAGLKDSDAGGLASLGIYARLALPLCAFVAANRLVAHEYAGRTLLFLETLPVSRARVLTTKAVAGLFWVGTPAVLACLAAAQVASSNETLEARYLAITLARVAVFGFCFFSFAVFAATLGRFRWMAWLSAATLVFVLENTGQVRAQDLPILALADRTLGLERRALPVSDLLIALGAGGLAFALALALVTLGRGAVAMALARRMTAREKVFAASALIAVVAASDFAGSFRTRPRYALKEGVRATTPDVEVAVGTSPGVSAERAAVLAAQLADDAEGLRRELRLAGKPPPLFAVPHAGLDADLYVQASLGKKDGVVVQAAFDRPGFDPHDFRAFAASRLLAQQTHARIWKPDRAWFTHGFVLWWTARRTREDTARLAQRALAAGRALPADALANWGRTAETLGACLASGLAWAAVKRLEDAAGADAVLALAREALAREAAPFFEVWSDEPFPARLARAHAPSPGELAAALARASADEAARPDGLFSRLPRYQAAVESVASGRQLRVEQRFAVEPAGAVQRWRVLTRFLKPWELGVDRLSARRFDLDATSAAALPLTAPRGERLFAALEVEDPVLGCAVRPFARRWVLE